MKLSAEDLSCLGSKGISRKEIEKQVEKLHHGSKPVQLVKPATRGGGIKILTKEEKERAIRLFDQRKGKKVLASFVPASGAASRMFRMLENPGHADPEEYRQFTEGLTRKKFAFYSSLDGKMHESGWSLEEDLGEHRHSRIIEYLLSEKGLGYASCPKGLIEFHHYRNFTRTPFAEHLEENILFWHQPGGNFIHFTINPSYKNHFQRELDSCREFLTGSQPPSVEFSEQRESTNTIALDESGRLFRNRDGSLLLRPAGHGALIHNLNEIESDLVFIKNIDNIVHERFKEVVIQNKKILGGYLLKIQEESFKFQEMLLEREISPVQLGKIFGFARNELNIDFPSDFLQQDKYIQKIQLATELNRPLRVCGMVENTGEPGGGPFFLERQDGSTSLQIVEGAQIDRSSNHQNRMLKQSTHFNPVDLVCGIKDFAGRKFNLLAYVDEDLYLVSEKSMEGKSLKALELPGLWNGAMADWNTVFIEIPIETFNPVKTVNDLLRPTHQG